MKAALRAFLILYLPFLQEITAYSQSLPDYLRFDHFNARYDPNLFGNAMHINHAFDGVTHPDYNTTLQYTLSGNLTIEFWMRVPPYMLTERQGTTIFEQEDGAVRLYLVNPCVTTSSTPPCDFTRHSLFFEIETFDDNNNVLYGTDAEIPGYNEWFHVAIVVNHSEDVYIPDDFYNYDLDSYPGGADQAYNDYFDHQVLPGQMAIYINGVKQMRRDPTDSYYYTMMAPGPNSILKNTNPFVIGSGANGIWIDDFRIWKDTAKLQSGIRSTMNAPLPADQNGFAYQDGLYAYFKYDASPGSTPIHGTEPGAGFNRTVPNMSRGAGSPTNDGNYALMGTMTFDSYGAYPTFGKGRTFRLVRTGSMSSPSVVYENWDGTFPGVSDDVTIDLEHEDDIVDLNNHVFFRSIFFKKGKLRTNGYELMVSHSTLGASPASYVITSKGNQAETGPYVKSSWYRKDILTTLPIGTEAHYLPVAIAANSSDFFTPVASVKETLPEGLAEQSMALQVPWDIKVRNASDNMTYKVKLQWNDENEGPDFDRSHIYFANFHNGAWRKLGQGLPAVEEEPGVYSATINVDVFSEFTVIGSPSALPVRLARFSAQPEGRNTALLTWSTTYEENTSHFVIEKSSDAVSWHPVGQVMARNTGEGANHYRFTDRIGDRNQQLVYYRLKMTDLDGQFAYSKIESVRLGGGVPSGIYPNPVNSSFFNLPHDLAGRISQVKLLSAAGLEVLKSAADASGKVLLPTLNPGLYIAEMTGTDGTVHREKVMIGGSRGN
ncbi:MAG: hypothetical protein ABS46_14410 [Cytophagaceae bacterium SCN 52-12]|nr:MAG: hypothetical protein ABS46_14410 [Cytophagaceae bacterium SCN 52-12]